MPILTSAKEISWTCENTAGHRRGNARRLGETDRKAPHASDGEIGPGFGFHCVAVETLLFGSLNLREERAQCREDCRIPAPAAANDPGRRMRRKPVARKCDRPGGEFD